MTAVIGSLPAPSAPVTTVAVVAASLLTRVGIAQVLGGDPQVRVTATVAAPAELPAPGQAVDLIIWDQAGHCGGDATQVIVMLAAQAPVLVVAGPGPATDLLALLRAGARGLVTGDASDTEFRSAAAATANGAVYLAAGLAGQLGAELGKQRPDGPLSRREIETLRLIVDGCTHRQVARRLGLTEETVNTYVKRIRGKLNAGNKAELTRKAIDLGYATPHADPPQQPKLASVQPFRRSA